MEHGQYKSLSRLIVLAATGVMALGLAGCNRDSPNKSPADPGGMSKQEPQSPLTPPEKK